MTAPDLRGYGGSGKPDGGEDHVNHSKRAMAADQVAAMQSLGFPHPPSPGTTAEAGWRWTTPMR